MTDPIRIPVLPREDNYGDCSYDYVRIDPTLARRIVELAQADAPPVADDDAAVEALVTAMTHYPDGPTWKGAAQRALAAIKAGKVPGVWCGALAENIASAQMTQAMKNDIAKLKADLAACRAELAKEKARSDSLIGSEGRNYCTKIEVNLAALTAQRDRLAGLLLRVFNEWDKDENGSPTFGCMEAIADALAELNPPTPTAPTNGEGDAK